MEKRNFIDREVFERILGECPTQSGSAYQDTDTIYGDMSRLVVAWLAHIPMNELHALYNKLGWKGSANFGQYKSPQRSGCRHITLTSYEIMKANALIYDCQWPNNGVLT